MNAPIPYDQEFYPIGHHDPRRLLLKFDPSRLAQSAPLGSFDGPHLAPLAGLDRRVLRLTALALATEPSMLLVA